MTCIVWNTTISLMYFLFLLHWWRLLYDKWQNGRRQNVCRDKNATLKIPNEFAHIQRLHFDEFSDFSIHFWFNYSNPNWLENEWKTVITFFEQEEKLYPIERQKKINGFFVHTREIKFQLVLFQQKLKDWFVKHSNVIRSSSSPIFLYYPLLHFGIVARRNGCWRPAFERCGTNKVR